MGELHKDTSQALFGLSKTPEQVAEEFEAAAKVEQVTFPPDEQPRRRSPPTGQFSVPGGFL